MSAKPHSRRQTSRFRGSWAMKLFGLTEEFACDLAWGGDHRQREVEGISPTRALLPMARRQGLVAVKQRSNSTAQATARPEFSARSLVERSSRHS
jgi:hypothetical protein